MAVPITFAADGGACPGVLAEPKPGARSGRGVVVIQEWWGLDEHIHSVADRFAEVGFVALAPDLYRGKVTKSPDEAGKLLMALNIARAEVDLRGAVAFLAEKTGRPVGTIGFCMGGALSLLVACSTGEAVKACVVYYGNHSKVSYDFDKLRAAVLGHWAQNDAFANAGIPKLEAALGARNRSYAFHHYPGTRHGFFNDTRPGIYDREAADKSWRRTLAFFNTYL